MQLLKHRDVFCHHMKLNCLEYRGINFNKRKIIFRGSKHCRLCVAAKPLEEQAEEYGPEEGFATTCGQHYLLLFLHGHVSKIDKV